VFANGNSNARKMKSKEGKGICFHFLLVEVAADVFP
jgi:hypothetical protein